MNKIAEKIRLFNAYVGSVDSANKLVGITDEVTLPDFEMMSETLSLAGLPGEIDSPSTGQFKSAQVEITFSNISEEALRLAADDSKALILRGAQEQLEKESYGSSTIGRALTIKGLTKGINFGKLKKGGYGNPSIKKEVLYYQDKVGETVITEVDKLNAKYVVNGVDMMADVADLI